ncbi:MAG: SseB family protein [Sporichthyaceae bacterium]
MSTRRIPASAFSDDDGAADDRLAAALGAFATDPARRPDVLAALHVARVLAPVVARPDEVGAGAAGLRVDKTSDISVPLLEGTDGRRALPVFTSADSLARWDPKARPVPVAGPRAAEVAVAEAAEVLVIDVAGPHPCSMEAPELRALVSGRGMVPAYDDDRLGVQVRSILAAEPAVAAGWVLPAPEVDARLAVRLVNDEATETEVTSLLASLAHRVAGLPRWADHGVRGLDVALVLAADTPHLAPVFRRFLD